MLGHWTGTYLYSGKRLPQAIRDQVPGFHIEITEFDGDRFVGTVEDDQESGGMRGIGRISGSAKNGRVSFVKEMPIRSIFLPDGSKIEEHKPHRKIYYSGTLNGNRIEGTWKFKFGIARVNGRLGIFPRSGGTFEMTRVE